MSEQIETLEHELTKADRRSAEQEAIIAKQREINEKLQEELGAQKAIADTHLHDCQRLQEALRDALRMYAGEIGISGPGVDDEYDRLCEELRMP